MKKRTKRKCKNFQNTKMSMIHGIKANNKKKCTSKRATLQNMWLVEDTLE